MQEFVLGAAPKPPVLQSRRKAHSPKPEKGGGKSAGNRPKTQMPVWPSSRMEVMFKWGETSDEVCVKC